MSFFYGRAFDYNDFVKQVRGFLQGHPRILKSDETQPASGVTITGTGDGEIFVSTESYTPAGGGSGTLYRLTCTTAGSEVTSPKAQFTVEQIGASPSVLGTLTAGERFVPDGDQGAFFASPAGSPATQDNSPQHGLQIILSTSTDWAVNDTIEFRLVDHFIGRNTADNMIEERFAQTTPDNDGNFVTEWICRIPSVANAGNSPEFTARAGLQTSFSEANARYNVAVMGADDFVASNAFASQPNTSGLRYAFLDNSPFPFWLTCDADGFYVVARPGAVYEHITAQIIGVFATGNQHPKPLFIGAMSEVNTTNFSETDNDLHAAFWDPGNESSARFRWVDGSWYNIENRTTGYSKGIIPTRFFNPYKGGSNENDNISDLARVFSYGEFMDNLISRYDGSFELMPVTMIITDPQSAVVGDLKFIKATTGNGINSEDTTTDSSVSPAAEYIAFQNAQLTGFSNFCVMELVE
jgi:hypothetical protein